MARPALEVADIFRDHGAAWRLANAGHVSLGQLKVMNAIERCRTAALGGHVPVCRSYASKIRHDGPDLRRDAAAGGGVTRCQDCDHTVIAFNSCLMGKICNGELAAT